MQPQDQLEIIGPGGKVEFYLLDPARGVTNIGRHPDNDVVLDSPSVDLFQAVLDHQEKPYRIMILSEEAEARLGGQLLVPNVAQELHAWDTVEMDGYAIVLLAGAEVAEREKAAQAPAPLPAVSPAREAAAAPAGFVPVLVRLPDQVDEIIVAELSERDWTLDVEQTASFELTVTNGGGFVATFEIRVEGVEGSWVTISPDSLNLNEGARGTVALHITPPRLPSSSAGRHHLAVVVTSSNYPNRASRLGATLTINPYYEFAVGELSPKQQTVSWRKQSGHASLPIANRGNSGACFRLEGADDERGCRFEFDLPGEEVQLARQAEMSFAPEETWVLPVSITPIRRRFIGLRARSYSYTITTALVEAAQTPRSVMGQIKSRPLIGPLPLLLIAVATVSLLVFLASPGQPQLFIELSAQSEGGDGAGLDVGSPAVLAARDAEDLAVVWWCSASAQALQTQGGSITTMPDEPVTLRYDAALFHFYKDPVEKSEWDPERDRRFFLNRLNAFFLELRLEFSSDSQTWRTVSSPAEFEDIVGTLEVVPAENGSYRLRADTWVSKLFPSFGGESNLVRVNVTPVQPTLVYFRWTPDEPMIGSEVTISWRVEEAEAMTFSYEGIEETLQDDELVTGSRTLVLERDTDFSLTASNRFLPEGVKWPLRVRVLVPTPTPIPTPVIERFDVEPLEITAGETVRLGWQVTGADTVTIDPPGKEFPLQGETIHRPTELTTYWLFASKQGAENSTFSEVVVNTPTPMPTPTPTPQPPVVQVFDALPKTIVEGDDTAVTLTWSVAGPTTDIQITGAGIPLTGLDPQGSISITISDGAIFVLTAYNGQISDSKHVQIGTIEATPVPPDAPVIVTFTADVEDGMLVHPPEPGTAVYEILEGAEVTLRWDVSGENFVVKLDGEVVGGNDWPLGPVWEDGSHELLASNETGQDVSNLFIRIAARVLPPPEEFAYVEGVFYWKYQRPDDILGFRLYKTPGVNVLVADTRELPAPVEGQYDYEWERRDDVCGVLYLVAVYRDPYNDFMVTETDAADKSWGIPCP